MAYGSTLNGASSKPCSIRLSCVAIQVEMKATHATGEPVESTTQASRSRETPARSANGRAIRPASRLLASPSKKHSRPTPYTPPNNRRAPSLPPASMRRSSDSNPPDRSRIPAKDPNSSVKTNAPIRHGPCIAGNTCSARASRSAFTGSPPASSKAAAATPHASPSAASLSSTIIPMATAAGHRARHNESPPAAPTASVASNNPAAPSHRAPFMPPLCSARAANGEPRNTGRMKLMARGWNRGLRRRGGYRL